MGPTPFYGARAKKNPKADFAMKQTNICRLSSDIIKKVETETERPQYIREVDAYRST